MNIVRVNLRQIVQVALVTLIIFAGLQFTMQSFRVQGTSMQPSFHNEEYLLVDKFTYRLSSPARGDVVVFHNPQYPSELYIKRIVGMPGETIEIRRGSLYVNGVQLEEEPSFARIPQVDTYSVTVPPGYYFVMGDNRINSSGSHVFGPVSEDYIVGKVWIRYWPPSEWGLSPDYSVDYEPITTVALESL